MAIQFFIGKSVRFFRSFTKSIALFIAFWMASQMAFSSGSLAPEMEVLKDERGHAEYSVLRQIHDIIIDLQMMELAIKNRRNPKIEAKLLEATNYVKSQGRILEGQIRASRTRQLDMLTPFIKLASRYGLIIKVSETDIGEAVSKVTLGVFKSGTLCVKSSVNGLEYQFLHLAPMRIGSQYAWHMSLPPAGPLSFWTKVRLKRTAQKLAIGYVNQDSLKRKLAPINAIYDSCLKDAHHYYEESYAKLYGAFEDQRFGLFQRISAVRKSLIGLSKTNTAMGTPEETGNQFNEVLEHLYSYGIDVSLSDEQRDFSIQGFLFAPDPTEARKLLDKLRFSPNTSAYNSPNS